MTLCNCNSPFFVEDMRTSILQVLVDSTPISQPSCFYQILNAIRYKVAVELRLGRRTTSHFAKVAMF
uniref:Uncharacterized protein n=1 Tax=Physcomitrium patens TaxID=3218 RepID=A0A2K1KE43_PHYPA|nr:hypothetical protein PHYPA_008425 [Physcomitrium patens]